MAGVKKILQNSCLIFAVCLICCTIKVQAKYFKTPYLLEMAKSDAAQGYLRDRGGFQEYCFSWT